MTAQQYVDISSWQSANIDWQAYKEWSAKGDGISRVAIRASFGSGFTDTTFAVNRQGALEAGIDSIIFYHYAYPNLNSASIESTWFRSVVGSIREADLLMLDFEEDVPQAGAAWAYAWLINVQAAYPKNTVAIYSYPDFIARRLQSTQLTKFPLIYAKWTFDPNARPAAPYPWHDYLAVQYSDKASNIPGFHENVDADVYVGPEIITQKLPVVQPAPTDPFILQAALDAWRSSSFVSYQPETTGIGKAWLDEYITHKHPLHPATSSEFHTVNWQGKPIVVQNFATGRYEWDLETGTASWVKF